MPGSTRRRRSPPRRVSRRRPGPRSAAGPRRPPSTRPDHRWSSPRRHSRNGSTAGRAALLSPRPNGPRKAKCGGSPGATSRSRTYRSCPPRVRLSTVSPTLRPVSVGTSAGSPSASAMSEAVVPGVHWSCHDATRLSRGVSTTVNVGPRVLSSTGGHQPAALGIEPAGQRDRAVHRQRRGPHDRRRGRRGGDALAPLAGGREDPGTEHADRDRRGDRQDHQGPLAASADRAGGHEAGERPGVRRRLVHQVAAPAVARVAATPATTASSTGSTRSVTSGSPGPPAVSLLTRTASAAATRTSCATREVRELSCGRRTPVSCSDSEHPQHHADGQHGDAHRRDRDQQAGQGGGPRHRERQPGHQPPAGQAERESHADQPARRDREQQQRQRLGQARAPTADDAAGPRRDASASSGSRRSAAAISSRSSSASATSTSDTTAGAIESRAVRCWARASRRCSRCR